MMKKANSRTSKFAGNPDPLENDSDNQSVSYWQSVVGQESLGNIPAASPPLVQRTWDWKAENRDADLNLDLEKVLAPQGSAYQAIRKIRK